MAHSFYHERLKAEDDLSRLFLTCKLNPIPNVVEGFEESYLWPSPVFIRILAPANCRCVFVLDA